MAEWKKPECKRLKEIQANLNKLAEMEIRRTMKNVENIRKALVVKNALGR